MKEEWKSIPLYNMYFISNKGNIKRNKNLKPWTTPSGYKVILLCNNVKNVKKYIHHLVAELFIGKRPNNKEINHIDGNPSNNEVSNLEYITHSQNALHAVSLGRMAHDNRKDIKLKDFHVEEIRNKYKHGNIKQKDLAIEYGVGRPHICQILKNQKRKIK